MDIYKDAIVCLPACIPGWKCFYAMHYAITIVFVVVVIIAVN